jgi:hypothetical protein
MAKAFLGRANTHFCALHLQGHLAVSLFDPYRLLRRVPLLLSQTPRELFVLKGHGSQCIPWATQWGFGIAQ